MAEDRVETVDVGPRKQVLRGCLRSIPYMIVALDLGLLLTILRLLVDDQYEAFIVLSMLAILLCVLNACLLLVNAVVMLRLKRWVWGVLCVAHVVVLPFLIHSLNEGDLCDT